MRNAIGYGAALAVMFTGHAAFAEQAQYHCRDGSHIVAKFANSGTTGGLVALEFGKNANTVMLPQVFAADGGRYVGQDMEFWIKGKSATLTRGGKATACSMS